MNIFDQCGPIARIYWWDPHTPWLLNIIKLDSGGKISHFMGHTYGNSLVSCIFEIDIDSEFILLNLMIGLNKTEQYIASIYCVLS